MKDKRKTPRIPVELSIRVYAADEVKEDIWKGYAKDISENGLCFVSS